MACVLAVFAQFERRLISQRTRKALAVKRSQGVRLGRPSTLDKKVGDRIRRERARGRTFVDIEERLNAQGVPTGHSGKRWYPTTVRNMAIRST
jgi:DNA invertase Pin-like site-specific DNA recombinase